MNGDDQNLTDEEAYLVASPANAARLRQSLAATERGEYVGLGTLFAEASRKVPLTDEEVAVMDELHHPPA